MLATVKEPGGAQQPSNLTWQELTIGGGGYVTGHVLASDGTKIAKTDTYGAYLWNGTRWIQLVTAQSFSNPAPGIGGGVWDIAISPSNTSVLYMMYVNGQTGKGNIYSSSNKGTNWTLTNYISAGNGDSNIDTNSSTNYHTNNCRIAVDPNNSNIVYVGSPSGLYTTANGGTSWTLVSGGWSAPTVPSGGVAIAYDPNSSVTGQVTQTFYVCVTGTGVYKTTNGGSSFTSVGGPINFNSMICDQNSILWVPDLSGNLWQYKSSTWTKVIAENGAFFAETVSVNPANGNNVICGASGQINISADGGTTWTLAGSSASAYYNRNATDVPWLAFTDEGPAFGGMSSGQMLFDPAQSNVIIFSEGIGVWTTTPPTSSIAATTIQWTSMTLGIENLDCNVVKKPPGGNPVVACWDRPFFSITQGIYPSTHGVTNTPANGLQSGWGLDYAVNSPSTIVGVADNINNTWIPGVSNNGGVTWSQLGSNSPGSTHNYRGGCIAAKDSNTWVWVPGATGSLGAGLNGPWYTTNGGSSWTLATVSSSDGWLSNYYQNQQIACYDAAGGNFYIYNGWNTGVSPSGIWQSPDGINWTFIYIDNGGSGQIQFKAGASIDSSQLRAVPGQAGNLFYSVGTQGTLSHPQSCPFYRTTNGSVSWTDASNSNYTVREVWGFGFGRAFPGFIYPAIYLIGWVNNIYGLWLSKDNCNTWNRISDGYPLGSMSSIKFLDGDMSTVGRVYVVTGGNGGYVGTMV